MPNLTRPDSILLLARSCLSCKLGIALSSSSPCSRPTFLSPTLPRTLGTCCSKGCPYQNTFEWVCPMVMCLTPCNPCTSQTYSCSTHPFSHLSTSTPPLIALSSPLCQPRFNPQPSPHSLTEGHLSSRWLFPLHSPHFLLSTFLTCYASAFLGRAALFGQPHRTCPSFPHP